MVNVNYWIRKTPQPSALLADEQRIEIPRNGRSWKDLTATIASLAPTKLTALDAQGHVIRSVVLENESESEKPAASAQMSDVQLFATLLEKAYEKGSRSLQPVIEAAMAFVEAQSQRLLKADNEIDRLRGVIHRQHLQLAELNGGAPSVGDEGGVIGALVAGAMQAAGAGQPLAVVGKGAAKK